MESILLSYGSVKMDWPHAVLSLLAAFLLSSFVAVVYERTYKGLSWSPSLVQAMVLGSMVAAMIMIAIGDNIARGIGIVGSLAIIRFRTNLRDPRDLVFLFGSLGLGIACGVQSYVTALAGALLFGTAAAGLHLTRFGQRRQHDGILRFQLPADTKLSARVSELMQKLTSHFVLITKRSVAQGDGFDYAFQVRFRQSTDCDRLIAELERLENIRGLVYINEQTTVEV